MTTVTMNRDVLRLEIEAELSKITPSNPKLLSTSVSYNAPVDEANAEVEALEKQGYLVVSTYGNDWDCGQILRYALGEDRDNVVDLHITQLMKCEWSPAIRNGDTLILIEDGISYDPMDYDWGKYRLAE